MMNGLLLMICMGRKAPLSAAVPGMPSMPEGSGRLLQGRGWRGDEQGPRGQSSGSEQCSSP